MACATEEALGSVSILTPSLATKGSMGVAAAMAATLPTSVAQAGMGMPWTWAFRIAAAWASWACAGSLALNSRGLGNLA